MLQLQPSNWHDASRLKTSISHRVVGPARATRSKTTTCPEIRSEVLIKGEEDGTTIALHKYHKYHK